LAALGVMVTACLPGIANMLNTPVTDKIRALAGFLKRGDAQ
jgi:hypothetical protein